MVAGLVAHAQLSAKTVHDAKGWAATMRQPLRHDPLVLKAEMAIDSEKDREAIQGVIRGALERGRRRAKSGEG